MSSFDNPWEEYSDTSDEEPMPDRNQIESIIDYEESEDELVPFYPPSTVEELTRARRELDMITLPFPCGPRRVPIQCLLGNFPFVYEGTSRNEAIQRKLMTREYYKHLRETEGACWYKQPSSFYRSYQNRKDRIKIIHKMSEVCLAIKENDKVFHLAVTLYDFVCACYYGDASRKICIAGAAILVSSKFNNDKPVGVQPVVNAFGGEFCKHELVDVEEMLLKKVGWHLRFPTAYLFLEYFTYEEEDKDLMSVSQYIVEISFMHIKTLKFMRSRLAAAAVALAREMLGYDRWPPALRRKSGYRKSQLAVCFNVLLKYTKKYMRNQSFTCSLNKKFLLPAYGAAFISKHGLRGIKEM